MEVGFASKSPVCYPRDLPIKLVGSFKSYLFWQEAALCSKEHIDFEMVLERPVQFRRTIFDNHINNIDPEQHVQVFFSFFLYFCRRLCSIILFLLNATANYVLAIVTLFLIHNNWTLSCVLQWKIVFLQMLPLTTCWPLWQFLIHNNWTLMFYNGKLFFFFSIGTIILIPVIIIVLQVVEWLSDWELD